MPVFDSKDFDDHRQVVFCNDPASGLKAIIAVHDTTRGPAVGGCRMWPYRSEAEALKDVLRLSRGMTYKSAISELAMGGGKCVVIGDPRIDKSDALFRALGGFVDSLGGRYVVAEDVGTCPADMELVRKATRHVAGIAERAEQSLGLVGPRVADDDAFAAAHRQLRDRRLVGHAARQPQHVLKRLGLGPVRPHAAAADGRTARGVVDGDDCLEAADRVVAEDDLLVAVEVLRIENGHDLSLP